MGRTCGCQKQSTITGCPAWLCTVGVDGGDGAGAEEAVPVIAASDTAAQNVTAVLTVRLGMFAPSRNFFRPAGPVPGPPLLAAVGSCIDATTLSEDAPLARSNACSLPATNPEGETA
ncbi:hypothetical protein GCM10010317_041160 [Streptomyces mirabilis]|nr:hypothetical protein GCM10010317_041160 [Streptomyces mirabilis]